MKVPCGSRSTTNNNDVLLARDIFFSSFFRLSSMFLSIGLFDVYRVLVCFC